MTSVLVRVGFKTIEKFNQFFFSFFHFNLATETNYTDFSTQHHHIT